MDHRVHFATTVPVVGHVAFVCQSEDAERVKSSLQSIGMKVVRPDIKLLMAGCDIELTTDDLKTLHTGEELILNGGPLGICVRLIKTPLDYLNENPLPQQQGTNP